ncbi:VOC family protein [Staphylococcus felis]|uniref:VOC family protein n=1 Tax=Staphylococcus felis TaxID=46127 RepID=UPI0021D2FFC9|nr:VOC family protein [Staphylococcus felis]UXR87166.1 VOC family protein [Staphylococcus felis]
MYKIGHLQYKVKNLENAMKKFEQLGFDVERANKKSKNAFIWFETGPYIELIEMNSNLIPFAYLFRWIYGKAMKERWKKWCGNKEGFVDFAIETIEDEYRNIQNFPKNKKILKDFGIKSNKVITWNRKNSKNEKISFSYLPIIPASLPFVVSDYSMNQRPSQVIHKNNIEKIQTVNFKCQEKEHEFLKNILKNDKHLKLTIRTNSEIDRVLLKNKYGKIYRLTNHMMIESE